MKKDDLTEKSSIIFIGKWVIILSIILTSSLGFLLGYFVGKTSQPHSKGNLEGMPLREDNIKKDIYSNEMPTTQQKKTEVITEKPTETIPQIQDTTNVPKTQVEKQIPKITNIQKNNVNTVEVQKVQGYSVQVGAFKNSSEAEILKEKLINKGYKAFITPGQTKKQEVIYKVKVGEFNTRKEAEVLSAKIRKLEGLNSFVTFK